MSFLQISRARRFSSSGLPMREKNILVDALDSADDGVGHQRSHPLEAEGFHTMQRGRIVDQALHGGCERR